MSIKNGDKVTIKFKAKLENGQVFSNSDNDGPLSFTVGEFDLIGGLNEAVVGLAEGEKKKSLLNQIRPLVNTTKNFSWRILWTNFHQRQL